MKTIIALLLMSTSAHAECLQWGRDQFGNRICMQDDLVNRVFVTPESQCITCASVTISNTPPPKCADGWTLVSDLMMRPMCAHELRKPE